MHMKHEFCTPGPFQRRTEILTALALLLGFFWLSTVCAAEVYTWTDENGVSHFSDVPPESGDSQQINVEDSPPPGTDSAYAVDETSAPGSPAESGDPASQSTESRAQQLRDQLAEERKERKESQAKTAAECAKNQQLVEQLEPARRVYYTDDEGEEARMDDEQRVGMVEEAKAFIAKNCK
jgi:hypothetical protein